MKQLGILKQRNKYTTLYNTFKSKSCYLKLSVFGLAITNIEKNHKTVYSNSLLEEVDNSYIIMVFNSLNLYFSRLLSVF